MLWIIFALSPHSNLIGFIITQGWLIIARMSQTRLVLINIQTLSSAYGVFIADMERIKKNRSQVTLESTFSLHS